MTLLPVDLIVLIMPLSIVAAMVSVLTTTKVHLLFGTGLTRWIFILALSIAMYAVSSSLLAVSDVALALSDVCIVVAGFTAYSASRWLKRTFEVGEWHDR